MVNSHSIKFWVTEEQYKKIKTNASNKGFRSIADYLRYLSLNYDFEFRIKIEKIHSTIQEMQNKKENKINLSYEVPEWIKIIKKSSLN